MFECFKIVQFLKKPQESIKKNFELLLVRKIAPIKRRLDNKCIGIKYKDLKDLRKGMKKDVAAKHGIP